MKPRSSKMLLVLISLLVLCLSNAAWATLPKDEVKALEDIAKSIGKRGWDFNTNPPCTTHGITCNPDNSHVTNITLDGQDLRGKPPPEIVRLPFLQEIHLNNNYLNGTLPPEWGSMQLYHISLTGNRITGSIPKEFGNISTLVTLAFESNQLSGPIPPELGNLTRIQNIYLTSNHLSEELPATLGKLTTLQRFWIGDNMFSGNIPNYIKNWTNLQGLHIQGSGLNGPIPAGISALVNLNDLRISDLSGPEEPFPPISGLKNLEILILRSCNITGKLPDYLGEMSSLETLDLSFNKLSGEIPSYFSNLAKVKYLYLTGNLLTGPVPDDWLNRRMYCDLSYNNFTLDSSGTCQTGNLNLFRSSLSDSNQSVPCSRSSRCPKKSHSLHINCGGELEIVSGDAVYEGDTNPGGPSNFIQGVSTWDFSNTGHFMDAADTSSKVYITQPGTGLSVKNSQLYTDARLSPISLTYYGSCLENGNYTVKLHFAELVFTDDNIDKNYTSLGRRIFDIYIQGKLVQKDFNIADEAGGARKPLVKPFNATVSTNTLEIRLYWAGKGTTDIPDAGVYGPLISAISAVNLEHERLALPLGTIIGVVAAVASVTLLVLSILWWKGVIGKRNTMSRGPQTRSFTLTQLEVATDNFHSDNHIGEGGFGPVYKGILPDGTVIAVKQLSSKSRQGDREFLNEIGMISAFQHPHLVTLHGCCMEGNQLLLVYEYLENNSLGNALYGHEEQQLKLDWPTRHKICVGIARGLAYLHEESRLKIVHRDIKPANILLDKDLNAKISDFGLAKLDEEDDTHISTRVAGTYGYMAPEYAMRGYLTDKADVYSFGVVALDIVCGRRSICRQSERLSILDWVNILKEKGDLMELVDPRLGSEYNKEQVMNMVKVGLLCTNKSAAARPSMSSVVSMLEGTTAVPDSGSLDSTSDLNSEKKFLAMKKHFETLSMSECTTSDSQSLLQSTVLGGPSTSSSFAADLYPMHSSYVDSRTST